MMELNKNSFFFYVLKQGGGKIDPRNIDFMIEALKEWLPQEGTTIPGDYTPDFYFGQSEYRFFLTENLK
jgi:hypothetical protein